MISTSLRSQELCGKQVFFLSFNSLWANPNFGLILVGYSAAPYC